MKEIKLDDYMDIITSHARVGLRRMRAPTPYDLDDMIQEGKIAFIKAKRTDKQKSKFSTYLTTCIRNRFYSMMVKSFRRPENDSIQPNKVFKHPTGLKAMMEHTTALSKYNQNGGNGAHKTIRMVDSIDTVKALIRILNDKELTYVSMILSDLRSPEIRRKMKISKAVEKILQRGIAEKMIKLGIA